VGQRRRALEVLVRGCVVFDLDGTLVDTARLCADLANAMLAARGAARRVTASQAAPHMIAGGLAAVAALLGPHGGEAEADLAEFRARYAATPTPPDSLYPGARAALQTLAAKGFALAIWSNKSQALCDKTIAELGLGALFAAVVGTGPGAPLKPDPAGFDLALGRAGGDRARCAYVGDSELDHKVATVAGVAMVMITHGYGCSRPPGVAFADSFDDLPAILEALLPAQAA
jgi:phosphoglycolate phosphatase